MENSMNTMSKPTSSNQRTSHEYSSEESGWTVYFEDFSDHKTSNEHMSNCSPGSETSSLVSDAASLARKRSDRSEQLGAGRGSSMVKTSKRSLSFKKRKRTGRALVENALVDTASSRINMSHKVCDMNDEMDMDAERNDTDHANISQEKVVGTSGQIDERSEVRFVGRDSDCTELKKKGLCLVPLSMIVNYLR
ncbi:hypothetical protein I3843_11G181100 [Carya illinoinensis]|uniref:Uncharacterized protein n=1 Tax=Carya illinoinensis TaxID=32201 RepID=A0A8T1NZ94_CARIL|nr:vascular-related unknown protein 4-like [Carya illinoinensis]KAG2682189.1 hypothetical protein I3760_11G180200 [Carya illinoinensis]KAG6637546.1 hypothetical protein CIPAW_11G185800 [Carya illinoinensis]KAG6689591.1 hypothetical protein I3842_11G183200 [Carya illinoinensis]KAG7957543.1 hypothetical protein I3843_11G181100 [Carya illinoinensis]